MTAADPGESPAEVWGSTWIPAPSPVDGFGDDSGYAIAFVRVDGGPMLQVLVDATDAPAPGARGDVRSVPVDDETIDVFTPRSGAGA